MSGFITLAVGDAYLQRAAAFAMSAKRFGYPTILMYARSDPSSYPEAFSHTVSVSEHVTTNSSSFHRICEAKAACYSASEGFDVCAFVDADSLVIRDPTEMFRLADIYPIHTPGARTLDSHESWACPADLPVREIANQLGISVDAPLHTLNGGFLLWKRGPDAQRWFNDIERFYRSVHRIYRCSSSKGRDVRDELCMSLAFAAQNIRLPMTNTSIGVWDAHHLKLDIESQQFECTKGYYWEGHAFTPYIAHFGGKSISQVYQNSVAYLFRSHPQISLPLFGLTTPRHDETPRLRDRADFNGFSITRTEYDALAQYIKRNKLHRILEFGPGASTWAFLEAGCEVLSLEYQRFWIDQYRKVFERYPHVQILKYENNPVITIPELEGLHFDLAFVDSPVGNANTFSRLNSCEFSAKLASRLILHDARRPGEQATIDAFCKKGWHQSPIPGAPNMIELRRPENPATLNLFNVSEEYKSICPVSKTSEVERSTHNNRCYDFSHWDALPKVSCQCITYGRPHLLNEAVESFLRQDYPGEKELIILNDHPEVIIEKFDHPDVHVFHVPRRIRSIGEKRNVCCALSTGQIFFPWDDDDISLPWRISLSIERMMNRHYFKPDRLWYWKNGEVSTTKAVAHAMGAWSHDLFDEVGGYPHIQSGQDQAIENLFAKTGKRRILEIEDSDLFYIYRFPGTGSYHLSSFGYGRGLEESERYVSKHVPPGSYQISPHWKQNYLALVAPSKNDCPV